MTDPELLSTFTRILQDLLGDETIELRMETTRADIPAWDSFAYVNFIVSVEMELGIKFGVADVESFETVGDIINETQALLA